MTKLCEYIDHTLLKPDAVSADIERLCSEAVEYGFYSVCVNSSYVGLCRRLLSESRVKIACVVGFPLGAMCSAAKRFETECACREGAGEIDMVLAIGALKEGRLDYVRNDIREVVEAARTYGSTVKVILETGLLSNSEIVSACKLAKEAGAAFVKTSTGFGNGGADLRHVALMRRTVGDTMGVKASGGIRDKKTALVMIEAGASRIGTSSGVVICAEDNA